LGFGLVLLVLGYAVMVCWWAAHPQEDAAILLRYAQHFAQGDGIVWNIGGRPVDGATDFLFMVFVAGLSHLGMGVEAAARLLGLLAHLALVFLVFFASRTLWNVARPLAIIGALFVGMGPGLRYVEAGFGTTFFALWVFLSWYWAAVILARRGSERTSWLFAGSCLGMGLTRPEGVLVALLMLVTLLRFGGRGMRRKVTTAFALIFVLVGGAYFLWHWHYFGQPLPNPYYKKGGGHFYPLSLLLSIRYAVKMTFPLLLAFSLPLAAGVCCSKIPGLRRWSVPGLVGAGLMLTGAAALALLRISRGPHPFLVLGRWSPRYFGVVVFVALLGLFIGSIGLSLSRSSFSRGSGVTRQTRRLPLSVSRSIWWIRSTSLLLVGYVLMWALVSRQMNFLGRFQYAIMPVVVLMSLSLLDWAAGSLGYLRWISSRPVRGVPAVVLFLIILISLGMWQHEQYRAKDQWPFSPGDGKYEVATLLSDYSDKGYLMVTTEAGLLPFYSEWRAIDAWGLNDPVIAREGLSYSDLVTAEPDIIMFHAYFSPLTKPRRVRGGWFDMLMTLKRFAEDHNYILAAAFADSVHDAHYYYVRKTCPDAAEMAERIAAVSYIYDRTGRRAVNLMSSTN
jgi:hypothetical protein